MTARDHRYVTVKIYAAGQDQKTREIAALKHIKSAISASPRSRHAGIANVRILLDEFEIVHPRTSKRNLCIVFEPLTMSLAQTRKFVFGGRLSIDVVKGFVFYLLQGLDFLHRKANLVHGGTLRSSFAAWPMLLTELMKQTSKKTTFS
jgi:serine/threonine-protein kinase SRPK3